MPPLLLLALIAAPDRTVYLPSDYQELIERREEEQRRSTEAHALRERWYSERGLHLVLRSAVEAGIVQTLEHAAVQIGVGLSRRIAQRYVLQGGLTFGTGFETGSSDGLLKERALLFDSSADVTLRIGSRRWYFGLGPMGRVWRVFEEGERFRIGGGPLLEVGFLAGEDRTLDLAARVHGGLYRRDGGLDLWITYGLSIAWHL